MKKAVATIAVMAMLTLGTVAHASIGTAYSVTTKPVASSMVMVSKHKVKITITYEKVETYGAGTESSANVSYYDVVKYARKW